MIYLAKDVVDKWPRVRGTEFGKQLLPGENAVVLDMGRKVTGDISDVVRYAKGLEDVRIFLVEKRKWYVEQCDQVDWRNLHKTLKNKPDGYRTWLSKQHSDFCATRMMVGYYSLTLKLM